MSEPWIKMRTNLLTNPKVVRISVALGVHKAVVCGACFALWSLGDQHSVAGKLPGYTYAVIDEWVGLPGFCAAAEPVGWVQQDADGVTLPHFGKHNGDTAKKRAAAARRASRSRARNVRETSRGCSASSVTKSAPSKEQAKSRAEKIRKDIAASNACPSFALTGDACSMLQDAGLTPESVGFLLAQRGVDQCRVEWAIERLTTELRKARQGKREAIVNPAGFVRQLVEHEREPAAWRAAWQRKNLAKQAAALMVGTAAAPAASAIRLAGGTA